MIYTAGTTGRPKRVRRKPPAPEQAAIGRSTIAIVLGVRADSRSTIRRWPRVARKLDWEPGQAAPGQSQVRLLPHRE